MEQNTTPFKPAARQNRKARIAIAGPTGAGKTYTALAIASAFGKTAVIDTENASASLYSDLFPFDVMEMGPPFDPRRIGKGIEVAAETGYEVIVIDSLSPFWAGTGGALELVDEAKSRSRSNDGFGAWREVTPIQQGMVDALVHAPIHVVVTLRSKMAYEVEKDDRGKTSIRKLGLAPVQRDMLEYEFDIVGEIGQDHKMVFTKSRMVDLADQVVDRPGPEVGVRIREWLGVEMDGQETLL